MMQRYIYRRDLDGTWIVLDRGPAYRERRQAYSRYSSETAQREHWTLEGSVVKEFKFRREARDLCNELNAGESS